jgi:hydrogenase maturation protease
MKTLVLGMGNPYARDDAAGIRLAEEAWRRLGPRPGLDWLCDCATGGLDLLEHLTGHDRVVVFDSIRAGGRPGDWLRFSAAALRDTLHLDSIHDANFATALELGRALGQPLPADEEIHIFAVEIAENGDFGEDFSPQLAAAWPDLLEEVLAEALPLLRASAAVAARAA